MNETYTITFERIGRNHNVPPLTTAVRADEAADQLAKRIFQYALPRLVSTDVNVTVNLEKMTGFITAGFGNAGAFTLEKAE